MDMDVFLAGVSLVLAIASYALYIRNMTLGLSKPHLVTWAIWAVLGAYMLAVQLAGGAGIGALMTGVAALGAVVVLAYGLFHGGDKAVRKTDRVSILLVIATFTLWITLDNPIASVICASAVFAVGFVPTFMKAYLRPREETAITFFLNGTKFVIALLTLQAFTPVTYIYPLVLVVLNYLFVVFLLWRRLVIPKTKLNKRRK